MLNFNQFGPDPTAFLPGDEIGPGVRLVFDPAASMELNVRQSARSLPGGRAAPTLVIHGRDRAPDDWFGLEIDLPDINHDVELTARNYPVHRLFLRIHYDSLGGDGHIDLADVAASDAFASRLFPAQSWTEAATAARALALRLTILIPSTPWFAMEIQAITLREVAHA